jgi:hypothetical protein
MIPVDAFRRSLDPATLATVDLLRSLISECHPGLEERIKWNAPSFAIQGDDRITLGLERKGGVRVVLHRGAKQKEITGFEFDDPQGLATWPTADRGVIVLKNAAHVVSHAEGLRDLCSRWIAATT